MLEENSRNRGKIHPQADQRSILALQRTFLPRRVRAIFPVGYLTGFAYGIMHIYLLGELKSRELNLCL
jgi:hypothetical protein